MAAQTRIYTVLAKDAAGNPCMVRLVRASHPSHALRHVAADSFSCRVATQDDLIQGLSHGKQIETLKAEQQELPET